MQRMKLRMKSMRRETYPAVSRVNVLLEVNQNRKLAKSHDDAMLYIVNIVEFLVDRCFRKLRMDILQKEDGNRHSDGKLHVKEMAKSAVYFQLTPFPKDVILQNSLEKQCKMSMWELEVDLVTKEKLQQERENLRCKVGQYEKYQTSYIEDLVELLTAYVRDETIKFARSTTKHNLLKQNLSEYEATAKELLPRVKAKLLEEAITYFGDKNIKDAIVTYANLNHKHLFKLAKICFPADAQVTEEKCGEIYMRDVRIGDRLLTARTDGTADYEDVFMFGHAESTKMYLYLELDTKTGHSLQLSGEHLIHIGYHGNLKPANEVKVGDHVYVLDNETLRKSEVTGIRTTVKKGAYCPHTTGGSLIVNNVLASCYTDIISHQVAHAMLLPARMLYHLLPSGVFSWMFPYDETEGMLKLLLKMKRLYLGM